MTGRRTIIGLCMLCALAFSAFAAQGASAASNGTTMFTCIKGAGEGPKNYSDPDCENEKVGGEYGHVSVKEDTETALTVTPETNQEFKSTVAGTAFTLTTKELSVTAGTIKNVKPEGSEHFVHGTGIVLTYSNVKTTPAGCEVIGITAPGGTGMITTNPLKATTLAKGDTIVLTPENAEEIFTEFEIKKEEGKTCALDGQKIKVIGSITLTTKGATLLAEHTPVTERKELRIGSKAGPVAGYNGTSTISAGEELKHGPIAMTTIATP